MIHIYAQYSFGGYKVFPIVGNDKEKLSEEVTIDHSFDYPFEADVFFNYGGARIAYKRLNNCKLTLAVRELPSAHRDGSGRYIPCAVQFIGDETDKATLDKLAIRIVSNYREFSLFFQSLFFDRGFLYIKGDKLRSYIEECEGKLTIPSSLIHVWDALSSAKGDVLLFVPTSQNFGRDQIVTKRVIEELQLGDYRIFASQIINVFDFDDLQQSGQTIIFETKDEVEQKDINQENCSDKIIDKEHEVFDVKNKISQDVTSSNKDIIDLVDPKIEKLTKNLQEEKEKNIGYKAEIEGFQKKVEFLEISIKNLCKKNKNLKKIIIGISLISLLCLTGLCNCSGEDSETNVTPSEIPNK